MFASFRKKRLSHKFGKILDEIIFKYVDKYSDNSDKIKFETPKRFGDYNVVLKKDDAIVDSRVSDYSLEFTKDSWNVKLVFRTVKSFDFRNIKILWMMKDKFKNESGFTGSIKCEIPDGITNDIYKLVINNKKKIFQYFENMKLEMQKEYFGNE